MLSQPASKMAVTLTLGVAIVALLGAGVIFRTTDPLTPTGDVSAEVEIPAMPETGDAPELGTEAFTRPMFSRDRAPGGDKAPAATVENGDPTQPSDSGDASEDPSAFALKGIIIGERGARAALQPANAAEPTWVGAGDTVGGWKVESINAERVRLRSGDEVVEIKFSRDE